MAIKVTNLFGELALESTLRKILSAVTFAKTSSDQLRVNVDNTVAVSGTVTTASYGASTNQVVGATNIPPYAALSWNNHDIREEYQVLTQNNFQNTRNRWTIT